MKKGKKRERKNRERERAFLPAHEKERRKENPKNRIKKKTNTSPSINDAVSKAASLGAARVVLAPYFLSRGRHVREDIPALAAEAAAASGLPVTVAEPFGVDRLLAAAVEARVASAEEVAARGLKP